MTTNFKKPLTYFLAGVSLSACALMTGETTESRVLKEAAIADAHTAPKELKLDYIRCYALDDGDKEKCHNILGNQFEKRKNASSWDYVRPFEAEMEREGFAAFLRDHGKICTSIEENPKPVSITDGIYSFTCKGGQTYKMSFERSGLNWGLVK